MTQGTLTLRALGRATLARQMLLERARISPLQAIERLFALQAQLARPPFVGLWSRVEAFRREDLAGLLARREVVRATAMRATLHLLSARDYLATRAAIQPALDRAMNAVLRGRGAKLDPERLVADARPFLVEGPRTFEEVRAHLAALHPSADERAMGYAIRNALPLVQVPTDATWSFPPEPRFALAEAWLGRPNAAGEGARALVLRYLAAYGPAGVADAQAWTGLPSLRETFHALRSELRAFRDEDGREVFDLPDAPRPREDAPAPIRFVPEYDHLIVGRADGRVLAERHRSAVFLPGLRVLPTLLVDGRVAGTWKLESKRGTTTIAITPFATLARTARDAIQPEGEALARFAEPSAKAVAVRIETPS